jgi:type II secretory pathway pseudopilin PulG
MVVGCEIRRRRQNSERGYVLLTLLLIVSIAAIVFLFGVAPTIKFNIQRDREEEMIHRGVQYSRAIQAYYRKFQRFPAKIEDLENTNQMRFLRKRYKDPITGKDFRLLHYGEAKMMGSGMMGGGTIPGASTVGANGQLNSPGLQTSSFGGFGQNSNSAFGQNSNSAFGQSSNSAFGQSSNSAFGQNSQNAQTPSESTDAVVGNGADADSNGSGSTGTGNNSGTAGSGLGTFGGAPIVGVVSLSKDTTIREFDKKRKYSDWQFIYDPTMDRGGLIRTPYQPTLTTQGVGQSITNTNGQNGTSPNGNGFGNSFGNGNGSFGSSFGNSPGGMQNTPAPAPSQPSSPPQ